MTPIDKFQGEFRWLSNFWPAQVEHDGITYPTVEHAYQAAKSLVRAERELIAEAGTPGKAKRMGRMVTLRPDWDTLKFPTMLLLVRRKFAHHHTLKRQLLATYPRPLIEGNHWGDTYWGVCRGRGENKLGLILMQVRDELRA